MFLVSADDVKLEVSLLRGSVGAQGATEGFLASVGAHVTKLVEAALEHPSTLRALVALTIVGGGCSSLEAQER